MYFKCIIYKDDLDNRYLHFALSREQFFDFAFVFPFRGDARLIDPDSLEWKQSLMSNNTRVIFNESVEDRIVHQDYRGNPLKNSTRFNDILSEEESLIVLGVFSNIPCALFDYNRYFGLDSYTFIESDIDGSSFCKVFKSDTNSRDESDIVYILIRTLDYDISKYTEKYDIMEMTHTIGGGYRAIKTLDGISLIRR